MRKLLIALHAFLLLLSTALYTVETKNLKFDIFLEEDDSDPNYMFAHPDHIVIDKKSNLYIVDRRDCIIRKYDNQGKYVFSCGKRGTGPGELNAIDAISVEDETLAVIGFNIINFYDKNGQILASKRHKITNPYDLIYDPLTDIYISYRIDQKTQRFSLSLRKIDDSLVSEIVSYPAKGRVVKLNDSISIPCYLFEKIVFGLDSKKNIIFAFSEAFRIFKYSNKKRNLIISEIVDPLLIPEDIRKNMDGEVAMSPASGEIISAEPPHKYSVIQNLMIDENDNIWIIALTSDFYGLIRYSPEGKMLYKYKWDRKIEYSQNFYSWQVMGGYLYYKTYDKETGLKILRAKL